MSTIILKQLNLINFKGIRSLSLNLDESTSVFGANGTGKTTVFDAFTWLLFGKDSTDRKDFEIKTLDENNLAIPKIEHEVNAIIIVDGEEISIKRILKEKWVKQRGALEAEFTGNETLYYWNDVPLSQKEFQNKVSQILDENIFKLITSPTAFNSLKWQDRRNVLIQIAGNVSDEDLAAGNSDYLKLVSQLSNKSLDEYKKQIAATIKKAKDDIKSIPTRIDEVERSKPETVNEGLIRKEITIREERIASIDNQLQDKAAAYEEVTRRKIQNQENIFQIKSKINALEFDVREKIKLEQKTESSQSDILRKQITDLEADLRAEEAKRDTTYSKAEKLKIQISSLEQLISNGRRHWAEVNERELVFNDAEFSCPTCKREFEAGDIEVKKAEMKDNFITEKRTKLNRISENGKANAQEKNNLEKELQEAESSLDASTTSVIDISKRIENLRAKLLIENNDQKKTERQDPQEILQVSLSKNSDYQELKKQLQELESITFELPENNAQELKDEKAKLNAEITQLKANLQINDQIKVAEKRISELLDEESKLAQEIANIEKEQYTIDNFIKLKIDTIEGKINEKFSFVKFKLFDTQINGAQVETCEALINGVPFSDANTASKINAGVDIINTLCEFYKVSAPIFLDNRESVSEIIPTNSQVINLIVSPSDKKLRIA